MSCCESSHSPPDTACRDFLAGANGRCVYCDHETKCHPGPGATCEIGRVDELLEEIADLKKEARLGAILRTAILGAVAGGMFGQHLIHWEWGGWIAALVGALFGGWIGSRA